jgi:hypothetical protein
MDSNLILAIVTSVCTAGSTAAVAITALLLSYKRIDRVAACLDRLNARLDSRFDSMGARFGSIGTSFDSRFDSMEARFELLTGAL